MIDSWLTTLGTLISESVWLAPLLAVLAGVLTSFTLFTFQHPIGDRLCSWNGYRA